MPVQQSPFGEAKCFTLANQDETLVVKVIDYGATVTHLFVPDKNGINRDIVLGFDTFEGFRSPINRYFGAVCGRIANRIGNSAFTLNDTKYQLATNNDTNCLHGGLEGFDKRFWSTKILNENAVEFTLESPDGDQNFPGKLISKVTYTVDGKTLLLDYEAKLAPGETKSTIINLTNHAYFNLGGAQNEATTTISDNYIKMSNAVKGYLDKTEKGVPSGKVMLFDQDAAVRAGAMYFGDAAHTIGERIEHVPKKGADLGYDHCYVVGERADNEPLVTAWSEVTGIKITFDTHEPSFQLYSGDFNSSELIAKRTQSDKPLKLGPRSGFCLEAQRYPDAINHDEWRAQVILEPGQVYTQHTYYTFGLI